jgi:hypothetical protein
MVYEVQQRGNDVSAEREHKLSAERECGVLTE